MSVRPAELYVPGPLHPDMFDGETPIWLPVETAPRLYQVDVGYTVRERASQRVTVAVTSEAEAMRVAVAQVEENADPDEDDFDAEAVEDLDCEPGEELLQAWLARQEETA